MYRNPWTKARFSFEPTLTLKKCEKNSTAYAQFWVKTKDGKLRMKGDRRCLTASERGVVFLQHCGFANQNQSQQWECSENLLKLRNTNMYLVPFNWSAGEISLFGVILRSSPNKKQMLQTKYGGGKWFQDGSGVSLCDNMSETTYLRN